MGLEIPSLQEVAHMKPKIHPEYYDVTISCACGNTIQTRSTKKEMRLEICAACHPFFTGKQKLIDAAGRIERFEKRYKTGTKAEA
jgi:large subunit ribosomal protein L31